MSLESEKLSRLRWRCRRGMRELDSAMRSYLDNHYLQASADEQACFEQLQELQDPELFQLVTGKAKEARYQPILDKMSITMAGNT